MFPNLLSAFISSEEVGDETHYVYNDIWTSFAKDALNSVFLWAAIALAVLLIAVGIFVRFKRPASFVQFFKTAAALAVGNYPLSDLSPSPGGEPLRHASFHARRRSRRAMANHLQVLRGT